MTNKETDERAAFEAWAKTRNMNLAPFRATFDSDFTSSAWDGWQARAATAPTPIADSGATNDRVSRINASRVARSGMRSKASAGLDVNGLAGLRDEAALLAAAQPVSVDAVPVAITDEPPEDQTRLLTAMVNRFLAWPLPSSVCADVCATDSSYQFPRSGTSLLTAVEAELMLRHVLQVPALPEDGPHNVEGMSDNPIRDALKDLLDEVEDLEGIISWLTIENVRRALASIEESTIGTFQCREEIKSIKGAAELWGGWSGTSAACDRALALLGDTT